MNKFLNLKEVRTLGALLSKTPIIIRISLVLLFVFAFHINAEHSYSQQTKISLDMKNASIEKVLQTIEEKSEYYFLYSNRLINVDRIVSVRVENAAISSVLDRLFLSHDVEYEVKGLQIVLSTRETTETSSKLLETKQQGKTISGIIKDAQGEAIIGVNIIEKGTRNGTVTDYEGNFSLEVGENSILRITYIGYLEQEVTTQGRNTIDVVLQEDTKTLDELVVVGYGVQKKVNLTGAISSVKGDVINERTFNNTATALQGLAPGLTIIDKGGEPGSENSSINIRGIGTLGISKPLILVDNIPVSNLNDVLPQDIESVSVLKDAASASIYGSRAANGVILVTTKRGEDKKTTINYNYSYSMQSPTRLPKSVDAETYMNIVNESYTNMGKKPRFNDEYIQNTLSGVDPYKYPWTDYHDFIFKNGPQHSHALSITGGSKINKFRLSLNYLDQDGIIENVNNKRYSIRLNNDYQLHEKLTISSDISFIRENNTKPYLLDKVYWALYNNVESTSNPYYPDGSYTLIGVSNPAASIYDSGYKDNKKNKFMGSITADWELITDLHLKGRFSAYINNTDRKEYAYQYSFKDFYTGSQIGKWDNSLNEFRNGHTNIDKNLTLDYIKKYKEHEISGILGYQETIDESNDLSAYRKYFAYNDLQELNLGDPETRDNSGLSRKWALQSIFGRLNYNFMEKYLVEANFRYDGSSRFAKGNRWGFFPSVSAGWRISEEDFLKSVETIDNLKFRASWGSLGNQDIALYQYYQTIDLTQIYNFGGNLVNGAAMTSLSNKNITWETSTISNLGLDIDILNGLLSFTGEYFYKKTEDILLNMDIPNIIGLDPPTQNVGVVENKGWELSLTHRNNIGNFNYSVSANLSDVRNKILSLGGIKPQKVGEEFIRGEGYAMNTLYGYEYLGLMTQTDFDNNYPVVNSAAIVGSPKYRDTNNDGILNMDDQKPLGETNPRYIYGVNLNGEYKGFYVDAFFQGVMKNSSIIGGGIKDGAFWGGFIWEEWADRFHPENNPDGKYPIVLSNKSGPTNAVSNFWVQDASYLRLKNLQIGYNFPFKVIRKFGASKVRVYLSGTNLFTITDVVYDPEFQSGTRGDYYTQTKTLSAGFNVTF